MYHLFLFLSIFFIIFYWRDFFDNPTCLHRKEQKMTEKNNKWRLRIGIQVDKEVHDKSLVLRDKHNVNISSLCRNAIIAEYEKLEGVK